MEIEVGEEVEKNVYDFPVTMDDEARTVLLTAAKNIITTEEMEILLLEWYMVKILVERTEELINTLPEEDK